MIGAECQVTSPPIVASKRSNSAMGLKKALNASGPSLLTFSISTPPQTQFISIFCRNSRF